jgi:hypothetical protein
MSFDSFRKKASQLTAEVLLQKPSAGASQVFPVICKLSSFPTPFSPSRPLTGPMAVC